MKRLVDPSWLHSPSYELGVNDGLREAAAMIRIAEIFENKLSFGDLASLIEETSGPETI